MAEHSAEIVTGEYEESDAAIHSIMARLTAHVEQIASKVDDVVDDPVAAVPITEDPVTVVPPSLVVMTPWHKSTTGIIVISVVSVVLLVVVVLLTLLYVRRI